MEGRLPHAVSSHSPLASPPPLSPARLRPPHLPTHRDTRYTPSLRQVPHHAQRDTHHTSDSEISGGGGTQQQRRQRLEEDPTTTVMMMTRRRNRDPDIGSTRGRGRGGEQAATRSRDPSAPTVTRSVANLGFEFIVCCSKNVLYNSLNPFYQLGNNCKVTTIQWEL
jgi:hypothetical protein